MPAKAKQQEVAVEGIAAETAAALGPVVQMPDVRVRDAAAISKDLQAPFPQEMLRYNQAKGLTYIPISEVIARLNRVLGVENWSYDVVRIWREPDYPLWCLAHVTLRVNIGGQTIARDGVGGQQVKLTKKDQSPVDLGDEFKGAVSDALKKAAQSLGVGLELARTEEAKRWEEEVEAESRISPADKSAYESLIGITSGMNAQEKLSLRSWWASQYGDIKVSPEAGLEKLEAAIATANGILSGSNEPDAEEMIKDAFPGAEVVEGGK